MGPSLKSCSVAPIASSQKMGGRNCKRVLTDAEIDLLLAGDEPKSAG